MKWGLCSCVVIPSTCGREALARFQWAFVSHHVAGEASMSFGIAHCWAWRSAVRIRSIKKNGHNQLCTVEGGVIHTYQLKHSGEGGVQPCV